MSTELETKLKEITRKMLPHVYPSWLLEDLTECIALASIPQQDVGEQPYNYRWDDPDWIVDGPLGRIFLSSERDCIKERERLNAAFAAGRSVPSEYPGELIQRLTKEKDEAVARVARIIAVITPHADVEGRRMTYEGPDIAERFALLSDEVIAAVPSPVGQAPVACLAQDGCAREKARRIGMTTFPVECTCVPSPVGQEPQDETRVELVPNNYDCMLTCSKCGDGVPYYLLEEFDDISFCPNCGHRINKEKHGKKP